MEKFMRENGFRIKGNKLNKKIELIFYKEKN
jgi:hypothetical protein